MGEVTVLKMKQIAILHDGLALITFEGLESKGSQCKGEPETVAIRSLTVIACLKVLKSRLGPEEHLIGGSYKDKCEALTQAASFFGVTDERLTPHGLRRRGAT